MRLASLCEFARVYIGEAFLLTSSYQHTCTLFSRLNCRSKADEQNCQTIANNLPLDFPVLTTKSNNRPYRRYHLFHYGTRISVSGEFFLHVSGC